MRYFWFGILVLFCLVACQEKKAASIDHVSLSVIAPSNEFDNKNPENNTIETRFIPPNGYNREIVSENSFGAYLRNLKLKPPGTLVQYFNGNTKPNRNVYEAVVDLDIGKKDLHQCADAVMRLRAEYLWQANKFDQIHFNFTNGFRVDYSEWMNGKRMKVQGNKTWWVQENQPSNTYEDFWNYLELIFTYAGTASLEKELQKTQTKSAHIGDVLIQGGFPGHAVIIVDKAVHKETGESVFLLAQSFMPAQEIQILTNNNSSSGISPWHKLEEGTIQTPEWIFHSDNLRRF